MLDLFVAYSRKSEDEVRGLLEDLTAIGDSVGVAPEPQSDSFWWDQTLARIRGCDALLFALTPDTVESEACARQIRYAQALDKPLLAVELSERADIVTVPVLLSGARFVNYRRRDHEAALRLCRALRPIGKARPLPAVLPAPPELPPADLGSLRKRVAASKLGYHQQMTLIAELARDSRDLHLAVECRQLLVALRGRRDLSPSARHELDVLLRKTAATRINMRRSSLLPPPSASEVRASLPASSSSARRALGEATSSRRPQQVASFATAGRLLAVLGVLLAAVATSWLVGSWLQHGERGALHLGDWALGGVDLADVGITSSEVGVLLGVAAGIAGLLSLVMLRRSPAAARTSSATR